MSTTEPQAESKRRKVLAVDDSQINLTLLKAHLERMGLEPLLAESVEQGIQLAHEQRPDLILMDIMMPDIDGFEGCRRLKADPKTADVPLIFLSAKDQTADKIAGLKMGAVDYITKPFDPGEFKARIGLTLQMISLQEQLVARANTDELTGLYNRRRFAEILERECLRCQTNQSPLSLVMMDIDHFKSFNDTYGHLGGDVVLRQVADLLRDSVAKMDVVARFGGEEFVVIMPDTPHEQALAGAEKLRKLVAHCHLKISAEPISVTVSLGVATEDAAHPSNPEDLVNRSDAALYMAKHRGRNRVVSAEDVDEREQNLGQDETNLQRLNRQVGRLGRQLRIQALKAIAGLTGNIAASVALNEHARRVATYARAIAEQFDVKDDFLDALTIAAELHDLGKLAAPTDNLENLSPSEAQLLYEQHPLHGLQILEPLGMFPREQTFIRHHHERFDGKGFPDGIAGRDIPFGARILAVADQLDNLGQAALDSKDQTIAKAVADITAKSQTWFDPEVVEALRQTADAHTDDWPLMHQALPVA